MMGIMPELQHWLFRITLLMLALFKLKDVVSNYNL